MAEIKGSILAKAIVEGHLFAELETKDIPWLESHRGDTDAAELQGYIQKLRITSTGFPIMNGICNIFVEININTVPRAISIQFLRNC